MSAAMRHSEERRAGRTGKVSSNGQHDGWIRTPEAAKYLGVHIETVRRWAREGVIPAAKLGNRGGFRFRREDLDLFLEGRRADRP
jgi:excisionase family DNA binding protein